MEENKINREIKFRYFDPVLKYYTYIDDFKWDNHNKKLELFFQKCSNYPEFIIEQFSGLKDKNNKDIYEGDILKTKNYFGIGTGIVKNNTWTFYIQNIKSSGELVWGSPEGEHWEIEETKIIGNINENPELINA
jgi:uncharacterized phage protein (TIGR01671 family)